MGCSTGLDFCREILDIEQITDESMGLELTEDNIEDVLDEIRPYLVGALFLPHQLLAGTLSIVLASRQMRQMRTLIGGWGDPPLIGKHRWAAFQKHLNEVERDAHA